MPLRPSHPNSSNGDAGVEGPATIVVGGAPGAHCISCAIDNMREQTASWVMRSQGDVITLADGERIAFRVTGDVLDLRVT